MSEEHPLFGKDAIDEGKLDVHGDVTYHDFCQPHPDGAERMAICHVVQDGEDDRAWWIGFDYNHMWDMSPKMEACMREAGHKPFSETMNERDVGDFAMSYKSLEYAKSETLKLAAQLVAMT